MPSSGKFILAIDQGTSSTKSLIIDERARVIANGYEKLKTEFLENGFVEQDPEAIYQSVVGSVLQCFQDFVSKGNALASVVSCGISNQRETFLLWDKEGKPLTPAIVWACKRSVELCQKLIQKGQNDYVKERTGLIIDPYFSATKLLWALENNPALKEKVNAGEAYFGTVDSWLLWKLTGGKSFKTDYTNAHRTLLLNIHTLKWDQELLRLWGLEKLMLPEVNASASYFGEVDLEVLRGIIGTEPIPEKLKITSMIGDSHAATFGEGCYEPGSAKATMGTGCSIMMNIGSKPKSSANGLLTTVAWSTEDRVDYAFEGAIVSCGSTIEWLKNDLNLFKDPSDTEDMAKAVKDNAGVYLIPAFSGLGAPHWDMNRKASIVGLTFATNKNHVVRAALESVPYQIMDVLTAMSEDMGESLKSLAINGGLSRNAFIQEFLRELVNIPITIQQKPDVSALGAALLSGLKCGLFKDLNHIKDIVKEQLTTLHTEKTNHVVQQSFKSWVSVLKENRLPQIV